MKLKKSIQMLRVIFLLLIIMPNVSFGQDYVQQILNYRAQKDKANSSSKFGPLQAEQIQYLDYFEPDEQYRSEAEVEYLYNQPVFQMPTYDGTSNQYQRFAILHFSIKGKPYQLTAYQSVALFQNPAYKNHLFVPFLDETNGKQSYAGGRYIDLDIQEINDQNKITIDFNKAYNPYCAYSNGYRCPQPPVENTLNLALEAGEKKYRGPKNERTVNMAASKNFNDTEKEIINSADESTLLQVYLITDEKELAVLRKPSEDLNFNDPLIDKLAARMFKTVQDPEYKGVGIAGPQVGINKNVIWVQRFDKPNEPFEFYINPKIIWRSKLIRSGAEGCLSIPERKEDVLRSYAIRLQYVDRSGNVITENVEGFTAVIFQHEVDHLYGILFPDRLDEQKSKQMVPLNDNPQFLMEKGEIIP